MTDILVAIDTGGTRTSIEVAMEEEIRRTQTSAVFSGAQSADDYAAALTSMLTATEQLLGSVDQDRRIYVFIGAAGFAQSTRHLFSDAIDIVTPTACRGRIAAVGVANDAVSLLLGHDADGAIIAGTGSNVLVRTEDGQIAQRGGQEWVASDQGSGFWIGLRGIRRAFSDFEAGVNSALLQSLYEVYDIGAGDAAAMDAAMRGLVAGDGLKSSIARFAAATCEVAAEGNADARSIVVAEAEALAELVVGALAGGSDEPHVVQCGSLLSDDFYRSVFEAQLQRRSEMTIHWRRVETGTEAQLALARRLRDQAEDPNGVQAQFEPLVVRRGR